MPDYRRAWQPGGTYFFTITLLNRTGNDLLVRHIDELRAVIRRVRSKYAFTIHAWIVLPDHMHCVISLPQGDANFALRIRLIKGEFSKALPPSEWRSPARIRQGERGIWQRRFWEHLIRDDADFNAHMDYVHINPVKHKLVERVADWPYSTFHRLVEEGFYPVDWGGSVQADGLAYTE